MKLAEALILRLIYRKELSYLVEPIQIFMKNEKILNLINDGEGLDVEFKESRIKLNKDVFDSVC